DEVPDPGTTLVGVTVLDLLNDPLTILLGLRVAVDDTARVILVGEVDDVIGDLQDRHADHRERSIEVSAQRVAAVGVATHPNVVDEQRHEAVDVTGVGGERIAIRKLVDGFVAEEAVDLGLEFTVHRPKLASRSKGRSGRARYHRLMLDLVLVGGTVVDRTATPGVVADVGVTGDRTVGLGCITEASAPRLD